MSENIRKMVDKVKNFNQFLNENDNENGITIDDNGLVSINQSTLNISFKIFYVDNILTIKTIINDKPITLEIVKISENNFECFGEPLATSEHDAIKEGVSILMGAL